MSFLIPTTLKCLVLLNYLLVNVYPTLGASKFAGSVLASMSMSGCVPGMQMKLCIKMLDNKSPRDLTTSHISPSVLHTGSNSLSPLYPPPTFLTGKNILRVKLVLVLPVLGREIKPGVEQYELGSSSWNFTSGYYHHKSFQSKLNSDSYKNILTSSFAPPLLFRILFLMYSDSNALLFICMN